MSGFEAIFGVVTGAAGLVSLGLELTESAKKLKDMYHRAKDAELSLLNIVYDLETMAMAMRQLAEYRQQARDRDRILLIDRLVARCKQSTDKMHQLVDRMESRLSSTRGRMRFAIRESDVLRQLESTMSSLQFAYTMYGAEEQRLRDQAQGRVLQDLQAQISVIDTRISQQPMFLPPSSEAPQQATELMTAGTAEADVVKFPKKRKKHDAHWRLTFSLPPWLCRRIWDLTLISTQSGWTTHFIMYNVVPKDSPIFKFCATGDIPAIEQLLNRGEASLLDINQNGVDTLMYACIWGQLELCRYLLDRVTWPNHVAQMHREVWRLLMHYENFVIRRRLKDERPDVKRHDILALAPVYRLFLKSADFDYHADKSDNDKSAGNLLWLYEIDFTCWPDLSQPVTSGMTPELRLSIAIKYRWYRDGFPDLFLQYLGVEASNPRLHCLQTSTGETILHYVAHCIHSSEGNEHLRKQAWIDFGTEVMSRGADLHMVAPSRYSKPIHQTPYMVVLGLPSFNWFANTKLWLSNNMDDGRIWARMVQQAGRDLCEYGVREAAIWGSLQSSDRRWGIDRCPSLWYQVEDIVHGPTPEHWRLRARRCCNLDVYGLAKLPGSFPQAEPLPLKITWEPMACEREEGHWREHEPLNLESELVDLEDDLQLRDPFDTVELFKRIVDDSQDDHGVVALMQHRASRPRVTARRSSSHPPALRRRSAIYHWTKSSARRWLPEWHLCPFDGLRKFDCARDWKDELPDWGQDSPEVRSCFHGNLRSCCSAQESPNWRFGSFLRRLIRCRCAHCSNDWFIYSCEYGDEHIGRADCPQKRGTIRLDQLKVPERLRPYHPKRISRG